MREDILTWQLEGGRQGTTAVLQSVGEPTGEAARQAMSQMRGVALELELEQGGLFGGMTPLRLDGSSATTLRWSMQRESC